MYEGTSTEQKAKNAKSGLDSMSKPLLQSIRQRNMIQHLFTQRRLDSVCLIYMACFSPLYRQSENPLLVQGIFCCLSAGGRRKKPDLVTVGNGGFLLFAMLAVYVNYGVLEF